MSFLSAEEMSFKFTFGSNLGDIPIEINKISKNIKNTPGININSWILSPNFSFFKNDQKSLNLMKNKDFKKEVLYLKFKIKF